MAKATRITRTTRKAKVNVARKTGVEHRAEVDAATRYVVSNATAGLKATLSYLGGFITRRTA